MVEKTMRAKFLGVKDISLNWFPGSDERPQIVISDVDVDGTVRVKLSDSEAEELKEKFG